MSELLTKISSVDSLKSAWFDLKKNPYSKGVDGITIKKFEETLEKNLNDISSILKSGKYKFSPLRGSWVSKGDDDIRPLKIPVIKDRVVQKAIEMAVTPFLYRKYNLANDVSFGYIKGLAVVDAIKEVLRLYSDEDRVWLYQGDIKKFFDTIDINKLLQDQVFPVLPDKSLNILIREALTMELGNREYLESKNVLDKFTLDGIPQGCVLSPLFSNVYLASLDSEMMKHGMKMVRYADDFLVMCKTVEEAQKADKIAREILEDKLGLTLHPLKLDGEKEKKGVKYSLIERFRDQEFLGVRFSGSKIYPGTKSYKKIREKMEELKACEASYIKEKGLVSLLVALRTRIESWTATYWYTDYEPEMYKFLDKLVYKTVRSLMSKSGFPPRVKTLKNRHLNVLGIPTFTNSFSKFKKAKEMQWGSHTAEYRKMSSKELWKKIV